jgi:hypothetical protein
MKWIMWIMMISSVLAVGWAAGCGDGRCTPGRSIDCYCTNGERGAQVCGDDYSWRECACGARENADGTSPVVSSGGDPGLVKMKKDGGASTLPGGAMRLFVTSASYSGNLSSLRGTSAAGLQAGDALCNNAAQGAVLGGTWKAWLSDSTENAIDRIADLGPWYRIDGKKVFNNRANLQTTPLATLSVDERGETLDWGETWTGTGATGTSSGHTCDSWSTAARSYYTLGEFGNTCSTSSAWTSAGDDGQCDVKRHLICIEQ